jgi:hypothetical protein
MNLSGVRGEVYSPHVNVWSGIGFALENNQAVAIIVGKLIQQVKINATVVEKLNHNNMEYVHLKTQFVVCIKINS